VASVLHRAQHREMRAAYREQWAATGGGIWDAGEL
jgi:hypothetical protein